DRNLVIFTPSGVSVKVDSLSPYLFLFCAEVLTILISSAEAASKLRWVAVSWGGPLISHLLFVDDTLIFCQASPEAMYSTRRVLGILESASRLKVNLEKSLIVFSKNTPTIGREALTGILGVFVEVKHNRYLGMPTVISRSKREVFLNLKDR
ncbi:UNVERIFIED_CONTAM: hypothetical protein Sindi_2587200, partial [Sesamum indicum]